MAEESTSARIGRHGASRLPLVEVDSYNIELKDEDGFVGDRASKGAFQAILDAWRTPLKKAGEDPFGNKSSEDLPKKELDKILPTMGEGAKQSQALDDLFWALLNSREFLFNH